MTLIPAITVPINVNVHEYEVPGANSPAEVLGIAAERRAPCPVLYTMGAAINTYLTGHVIGNKSIVQANKK